MNSKISQRTLCKTIAQKIVAEPAKRTHWLKVLAAYMLENGLSDRTDAVINDVAREIFALNGALLVRVTSARPLTAQLRKELETFLIDKTGAKQLYLEEAVDPLVLGGVIARTPDAELDLTIRSKLKQLASI